MPKGAKLPPESMAEVSKSRLLHRIKNNPVAYADGARAWPAAAKQLKRGFKCKQVSHVKSQFTKETNEFIYGTQTLDRTWMWMKRYVGGNLKNKTRGKINPVLMDRCFQFCVETLAGRQVECMKCTFCKSKPAGSASRPQRNARSHVFAKKSRAQEVSGTFFSALQLASERKAWVFAFLRTNMHCCLCIFAGLLNARAFLFLELL